jgi:DNA repair photolyase
MSQPVIHSPGGAAGEYAQLALRGPYVGCAGGCRYCYNHLTRPITVDQWSRVRPLKDFAARLEKVAAKFAGDPRRVFIAFGCDPCQPIEERLGLTTRALEILAGHGLASHLLSKFGLVAARHFKALARQPRARYWITLTTLDPTRAARWEPGAAPPAERVESLIRALEAGIETGLSLEPTIYPDDTLKIIEEVGPLARHISLGKLNHMSLAQVRAVDPEIPGRPDWRGFLAEARLRFRAQGRRELSDPHAEPEPGEKTCYVKRDLRRAAK